MSADALLSIIAGGDTSGLWEIRCRRPSDGRITARDWFALSDRERCLSFMADRAATLDVYVGVALRDRREGGKAAISRVWCLWADVDAPAALERLRAYHPAPSLIVRSGSGTNVHAYWSLSHPLSPAWTERANRRLAYHIGADMKATDAARILRPPGSLNHKHEPAAHVTACDFNEPHITHTWPVAAIVGDLIDPPDHKVTRRARQDVASDDALLGVAADRYYMTLTGRPVTAGNVTCPFHSEGKERSPSMRLYDTTWYCWGCGKGGSVYEFGSMLWGLDTRGADFRRLRERLLGAL